MIEVLKMKITNWYERQLEKNSEKEGILFVPFDYNAREITEAMLIDGALPSEINQSFLDIKDEQSLDDQNKNYADKIRELTEIQDSLILEGTTTDETKEMLAEIKKELFETKKNPLLIPSLPIKKINLASYY